ncbi:MAG: HU family DNA-binding protein [Bacillales bacterium]|nr:HU family DNA-binding protein [Bacillales bacterium]MDY6003534.1 HU family DNA-binding protein [Bacilli bacterium]
MNKAELILEVAERANLSKGEAENAVEEMISIIEKELIKGNDVKLSGFGVFSKKTRLARKGTNPSSGDIIVIPENNTVSFRPSKLLKEKVN